MPPVTLQVCRFVIINYSGVILTVVNLKYRFFTYLCASCVCERRDVDGVCDAESGTNKRATSRLLT